MLTVSCDNPVEEYRALEQALPKLFFEIMCPTERHIDIGIYDDICETV